LAYFPENVDDVHSICEHVAHDIRNQYILATIQHTRRDGTFRAIQVEVIPRAAAASSSLAPAMATSPTEKASPPALTIRRG